MSSFEEAKDFFNRQAERELNKSEGQGKYVELPVYTNDNPSPYRRSRTSLGDEFEQYIVDRYLNRSSDLFDARICPRCGLRMDLYSFCPGHRVGDENGLMPRVEETVGRYEFDPETVVDGSVDVRQIEPPKGGGPTQTGE